MNVGRTSVPYHQYTLPLLDQHEVTLCTYQASGMQVDGRVQYEEGDGTLRGFLGRLTRLLRTDDYDALHVHSPFLAVLLIAVAALTRPKTLRRSILHVERSFSELRLLSRWMLLPAFLLFARVICCSNAARYSFPLVYRLLAGRRLTTIHHAVDIERIDHVGRCAQVATFCRSKDLELISVGSAHPHKNYGTILRALASARAQDVRLTIVCGPPAVDQLGKLARKLGVGQRVDLIGHASRDRVLQRLWLADAYVSMSRAEGMPVAVLEAMCCQCPVALSDIPAHREIRGPRADLIPLFETRDFQGLADAIDHWASTPSDLLHTWGVDCSQHVQWNFSQDWLLQQFTVVLDQFSPRVSPEWDLTCRCLTTKQNRRPAA
jgi:glycosyltransferase involved in cell wall biosynthesis